MQAIEIHDLKKTYANGVEALKGISLSINKGDFFALLGPNGAGKSTLISILCDLVVKTSGHVKISGHDIDKNIVAAKKCLGVVPQEFNFDIFQNVIDVVVTQAGYYGIKRKDALVKAEVYLKKLGLWEKRNMQAKTLSGGMKRRLMIARALVHEPAILILDEPTAGVDIELRRGMWEFIKELNKKGITIILTTHYLEEAEQLCKNIAIIDKGVIKENTSMKSLLATLDKETFVLDLKNPIKGSLKLSCSYILSDPLTLEVVLSKKDSLNSVFLELQKQGVEVLSMRNKTNRLEELFVSLTTSGGTQ